MKYLLDTNICIYLIKRNSEKLEKKIKEYRQSEICISSITLAELEYGVAKSKFPGQNKIALNNFLIPFEILPFEDNSALIYGKIRAQLEKKGKIIGPMDLLISAQVRAYNLTLITNNEREFKRVPGLNLENWTK